MKKQKKNNNKGFSLVELIVVVLIMAIIAVALAPQVMKWVDNSRLATDIQTYDSMYANAQLALTNSEAYSEAKKAVSGSAITITLTSAGAAVGEQSGCAGDADIFKTALEKICKLDDAKTKVDEASYVIYIYDGNAVKGTGTEIPNEADIDN